MDKPTEKKAHKVPKPKAVAKDWPKQDIQTVINVSKSRQLIGNLMIGVGGRAELNVAKGTIGRALVNSGDLEIVRARSERADKTDRPDRTNGTGEPGHYHCPWCDQATDDKPAAQMHVLERHADAILYYYSETYRQAVQVGRKPS